jgi:hypothetical protein
MAMLPRIVSRSVSSVIPVRHLRAAMVALGIATLTVSVQSVAAESPPVPSPESSPVSSPASLPASVASPVPAPATDPGSVPLRAWHFAEGNSRNGFETYFTLLNLSGDPVGVTALYNRDDGIRLTQWIGIEPHARVSLNANDIVGARAFGASFLSDRDIVVERTTTWGPGQNGETIVGFAPNGQQAWHFAEGTTRGGAATYFITQNLTDAPAVVRGTFTREDGAIAKRLFELAPRARDAFRVNDLLPDTAFSASFTSDQDVVIERTIMVEGERPPTVKRSQEDKGPNVMANGRTDERDAMARNANGVFGGLGYLGAGTQPGAQNWEFAEGSTRLPYRTSFVLFNPGQQGTDVRFQFRVEQGDVRTHTVQLPALSRIAIDPRDVVPAADFATSISADRPIIAERAYSSDGDGLYGVLGYTASPRRTLDSHSWYFAEGNTTNQIEMFFVLYNLSTQPAAITGTYFPDGGPAREQSLSLPAGGRLAVRANDMVPGGFFSTRFVANQDIVVERTLYLPGNSGFTTVGAGSERP